MGKHGKIMTSGSQKHLAINEFRTFENMFPPTIKPLGRNYLPVRLYLPIVSQYRLDRLKNLVF